MSVELIMLFILVFIVSIYLYIKIRNRKKNNRIEYEMEKIKSNVFELMKNSKFDIVIDKIKLENLDFNLKEDKSLQFILEKNIITTKIENINYISLKKEEKLAYLNEIYKIMVQESSEIKFKYKFMNNNLERVLDNIHQSYKSEYSDKYIQNLKNHNEILNIAEKYYYNRLQIVKNMKINFESGLEIEKCINNQLKTIKDEVIQLSNITIQINGNSIKYDNIIISKQGILVLDIKNISSNDMYRVKVDKNGYCTKEYFNGHTELIDSDIITEYNKKIISLQKLINYRLNNSTDKDEYLKVYGMIVMANSEVIENLSDETIIRASELYKHIEILNDKLDDNQMKSIYNILLNEQKHQDEYIVPDYKKEILNNIRLFNLIKNNIFENEKNNLNQILPDILEINKLSGKKDRKRYKHNISGEAYKDSIDTHNRENINEQLREWYHANLIFKILYDSYDMDDYKDEFIDLNIDENEEEENYSNNESDEDFE